MSGRLAIAVLAAGSARRFGGGKLDAECEGKPLGAWALESARGLNAQLAVVVGPEMPAFARDEALVVALNADDGIGVSAAAAAQWAIELEADALLIMLADMPLISLSTLNRLCEGPLPSAVSWSGDKPGAPACFPREMFAELAQLKGDTGAASQMRGRNDVRFVDVPEDELRDVDRPEDLADVAAILRGR
ncbi:NTP transferase domain-containing protein [Altererythrobacter salegens]|uniref:NTP transferase domain-containing protein n=1 Tax=Croceibacterium salegens TaxID=1737568 RepID=A0A6I4STD8_9SPHN|nr:nucleotidyltransferase family protein [Croceibacterium salegens]MXO58277.1 NTP transferase domain-containing protein [Croceibacterium salegens]